VVSSEGNGFHTRGMSLEGKLPGKCVKPRRKGENEGKKVFS